MTATLMNPTDLRGVRDAVLDSAGALAVAGAGTAAGWAGHAAAPSTPCSTCAR